MSWASVADKKVIEVARYMVEGGMTPIAAIQRAGVQWTGETFVANMLRVLKHLPANSTTSRLLHQAMKLVEVTAAASDAAATAAAGGATAAGGAAAGGGLMGFIAAHPIIFTVGLVAAGLLTAYVAQRAGEMFAEAPSAVAGPGPVRIAEKEEPKPETPKPVADKQQTNQKTIQGKWTSDWGTIEFKAGGNGTYTHKASILSGKYAEKGKLWEGTWKHTTGDTKTGDAYFRLSEDGNFISGEYWYGPKKGKGSVWSASRVE